MVELGLDVLDKYGFPVAIVFVLAFYIFWRQVRNDKAAKDREDSYHAEVLEREEKQEGREDKYQDIIGEYLLGSKDALKELIDILKKDIEQRDVVRERLRSEHEALDRGMLTLGTTVDRIERTVQRECVK